MDDIQAIKDFLLRHTEILRGRGAISSTTTGVLLNHILTIGIVTVRNNRHMLQINDLVQFQKLMRYA